MRPPRHPSRRGSAALAMTIALVIVHLVIVGVVVAGARDQDLAVRRVDAVRSFYAAEGGTNMAIKEALSGTDIDGDGSIGGISDDGNSDNDPAIGAGRVRVNCSLASGIYTLTARGRSNDSRRQVVSVVDDSNASYARRLIYCSWPNAIPQWRSWTGAAWSAPGNTTDFGAQQFWAHMIRCPKRKEVIGAASTNSSDLVATVQSNTTWGNSIKATTNVGTTSQRPFHLAYEQSTGHALLAYRSGNSASIYYRTWDGAAWSAQNSTSSPLTGNPTYIRLVPKKDSAEILLTVVDSNNDAAAMVWDGAAFGNKIQLETNGSSSDNESIDAAYELSTGRAMVVWGQAGNSAPQYRIWNGATWGAQSAVPSVGAIPMWIHLASDPISAKIMLAVSDDASDLNVNVWSGSSWGTDLEVETSVSVTDSRCFDVSFSPTGNTGLIAWGNGTSTPQFRNFNGATFGAQQAAPAVSNTVRIIQLTPMYTGTDVHALFVVNGGQNALDFERWNGSTFLNFQHLEDNVCGPSPQEVFSIPDEALGGYGKSITGWTEVTPS